MKFLTSVLVALLLFVAAGCSDTTPVNKAVIPELKAPVNDYAGMISDSAKNQLDRLLISTLKSGGPQIAILTIPSLNDSDIESYTMTVCETWKLGKSGKDEGVLIFASRGDRKMRIEVGRGLEEKLPDIAAGKIVRDKMRPAFKEGNFDKGFVDAVDAVLNTIK